MIKSVFEDENELRIVAENQSWDKKTLKQLKKEHNITFMTDGDGVKPVMIRNHLVILGSEDDGAIFFKKRYKQFENCFDIYWVPFLISDLEKAVEGAPRRGKRERQAIVHNYSVCNNEKDR